VFLYPFLLVKFKTIQHYLTKNKKAKKKKNANTKRQKQNSSLFLICFGLANIFFI